MIVKGVFDLFDAVKHVLTQAFFEVRIHVACVHYKSGNLQKGRPDVHRDAQGFVAGDDDDIVVHGGIGLIVTR